MGFLPSSGCVSATAWMHHMDAYKTQREKARRELHKNTTSYTEKKIRKQHSTKQLLYGH